MFERDLIENQINEWVFEHIGKNFSFRKYQLDNIVDIIYDIVNDGKQNRVIEAPTGSGKSIINIVSAGVLAEYYDKTSYILVSDLYLLSQYDDFIKKHPKMGFASIKGQTGNYVCALNGEDIRNADCRIAKVSWGSLFSESGIKKNGYDCARTCKYVRMRKKAVKAKVCLMTYQLYLYVVNVLLSGGSDSPAMFKRHDCIFCDECHNIPEIIQNQYSPSIREIDFDKLVHMYDFANIEKQTLTMYDEKIDFNILNEMTLPELTEALNAIWKVFIDEDSSTDITHTSMMAYLGILRKFSQISDYIGDKLVNKKLENKYTSKEDLELFKLSTWFQNYMCFWGDFTAAISNTGHEYIVKQITTSNTTGLKTVSFKCTKEDFLVYNYLLRSADWKVFVSATIGGEAAYSENMGFKYTDDGDGIFSKIPSTFDFSNSPIYYFDKYKMNYQNKDRSLSILMQAIYSICTTKFADNKGIIQTGSYENAKKIYDMAPPELRQRLLMYNGSNDKTFNVKIHQMNDNTILIGPTLCEGIDLPGDDCRFIIILKMPYPNLADHLVQEKIKLFPLWYNSKTSTEIIQGIGRGVRYDGDWCVTYILDGCFTGLYNATKDQYPEEIQKRIITI